MLSLRSGLLRNLGGIGNIRLHTRTRTGTKYLIEEYIDEVCQQLTYICNHRSLSMQEKFDFFFETRQSFGRSALLLSGGASLGMYHMGVVRALFERGLLPRIISGASAGALIAALVGCLRPEEMKVIWEPGSLRLDAFDRRKGGIDSIRRRLHRLLTDGVLMDINLLNEVIVDNIGDITFKEAYHRTGRIINITVGSTGGFEKPRILNYLTAPNVLIASAASASCALKYLYKPVSLMAKDYDGKIHPYHPSGMKWSDGSVENDLPMRRLSELFNVNHFIVSQTNPHVVPFLSSKLDQHNDISPFQMLLSRLKTVITNEMWFRLKQMATLFPSFEFSPVVHQNYIGDITIVPRLSAMDYFNVVTNPSIKSFQRSVLYGQRFTWPKISYIQNHIQIEQLLDRCTQMLRKQLFPAQVGDRYLIVGEPSMGVNHHN
mmetsp:Transcript_10679/g.16001  ORF Transcript_10679/g.16001 Transcript_10679/m.16001 type:complete len:432 (-) Transcript_10679:211-1506(-)